MTLWTRLGALLSCCALMTTVHADDQSCVSYDSCENDWQPDASHFQSMTSNENFHCCERPSGFTVGGDYLFWRTRRTQLPYSGILLNGTLPANINGVPLDADSHDIQLQEVKYDRDHGWRVFGGYRTCSGWELKATFTKFENKGSDRVGDGTVDGDTIYANLIDRSLADNAGLNGNMDDGQVDEANATLDLDYWTIDIDLISHEDKCTHFLTFFGGFRHVSIDQRMDVAYINTEPGNDTDRYDITLTNSLQGYGMRGGGSVDYPIWGDWIKLHTHSAFSLLLGEFEVTRFDRALNQSANDVEVRRFQHEYHAMVPAWEVGVAIGFERCGWILNVGYEFVNYFNMFQHIDFPGWDDVDGNTAQSRIVAGPLSFDGMTIHLSKTF